MAALRAHLMGRPLQVVGALHAEAALAAKMPAQGERAGEKEPEKYRIDACVQRESKW